MLYVFVLNDKDYPGFISKESSYKLIYIENTKNIERTEFPKEYFLEGKFKSAKIEYWVTMATLKLSELHLEGRNKKLFRRNFIFRNGLKKIYLSLLGKVNYDIVKSHFIAAKHFKFWNQIRYKDNGYNPFD